MEQGIYCEAVANQPGQKIEFKENIVGIDEWPMSKNWPDGELSYRLSNFSEDLSQKWQQRAIIVALRMWRWRIKKIWFRRERNPDVSTDLDFSFKDLAHFENKKGTFAHAFFPGQGAASGICHFNEFWDWVAASKWQTLMHAPLVPIGGHEIGHMLGLRHDTSSQVELMYPSFNLGRRKWKLGPNTVSRIQDRYDPRTISQRIIDYFALRRWRASDFR